MLEWSIDALQAVDEVERDRRRPAARCPTRPRARIGVPGGRRALALGARRAARGRRGDPIARPRRRAPARDARDRAATASTGSRPTTATPRSPRRRSPTRSRRPRGEAVVRTLDRSALWAVQTPQVFRRAALERALERGRRGARRRDRRRLARRAGGRDGAARRRAARQPQGHHAARPPRGRAAARRARRPPRPRLSRRRTARADRLPRPPAPRRPDETPAEHVLHRRQRRALPRGGGGARDRGARASAEHVYRFTPGARRLAAPAVARQRARRHRRLLRVRARGDRPASSASRPTSSPAARTAWRRCSRRATGTTSSARSTSSATRALDHDGLRRLGRTRPVARRASGGATSRWLGEAARERAVRHPRPPRSREDLGPRAAAAGAATCATSTSSRWTGSPSRTSRSRCRPPGCASRSARSTRSRRSSRWCVDAGNPIALSSDAHTPEHLGLRLRARRSSCSTTSASPSSRVFERRERRLEPIGAP